MEEVLCNLEFYVEEDGEYIARMYSELGGKREYRGPTLDNVLAQVMMELQEEFKDNI